MEVLTIAEAVKASRLSRSTLFPYITSGELPSIQVGGRRLIPVEGLERFLASRLNDPQGLMRQSVDDLLTRTRTERGLSVTVDNTDVIQRVATIAQLGGDAA